MLTETLSGKCPCCKYDKMLQRYGSCGYFQLDGCPNCGFGYGTNNHDDETFGIEAWLGYGVYMLSMVHDINNDEYPKWLADMNSKPNDEVRKMVFDWTESETRCDDIEKTIFVYTDEDVKKHMETNPVIFKQL